MHNSTLGFLLIAAAVIISTFIALFTLNSSNSPVDAVSTAQASGDAVQQATQDELDTGLLYVQQALGGAFTTAPSGNPDEYTLTLNNVWPETTFFANRPSRNWGRLGNSEFIMSGLFNESDPPNASLAFSDSNIYGDLVILELMNPHYDSASQTLVYSVRFLDGQDPAALMRSLENNSPTGTASFGSASLYIDDYSYDCTGTIQFTVRDPSGSPIEDVSLVCCNTNYRGNRSNANGVVSVDYPILCKQPISLIKDGYQRHDGSYEARVDPTNVDVTLQPSN